MELFRSLADISLADVSAFGGKAARLGEALRLGCLVPEGVVLSTELYHRFMQQGGLQGEIASILSVMQPTTMTHFEAAAWAIRLAFQVRRIPEELVVAVRTAWQMLERAPMAVRSSSINEDSPNLSFVGQHATVLDVSTEESAIEAVLECWISLFSARALSYARRFGVDLLNSGMAVLLQRMVSPSVRGAMYTVDPISGDPDVFVLEILEGPRRGVVRLDPYERRPGEPEIWDELRRIGLLLDEHELAFQAIEWGMVDGDVVVLRVRPVTKVLPYLPQALPPWRGPLELVGRAGSTRRALRPYSWYHRSLSEQLDANYRRCANKVFQPPVLWERYYVHGYLYSCCNGGASARRAEPTGGMRYWVRSLQRLRAGRKLDREYRALRDAEHQNLMKLNQCDLGALSKAELAQRLRQVTTLAERFSGECGRLGDSSVMIPDIFRRLHRSWLKNIGDPQMLLYDDEERFARRDHDLMQLLHNSHDEAQREAAFRTFFCCYRHLFVRGRPLDEEHELSALQEDEAAARAFWETWAADNGRTIQSQRARRQAARQEAEKLAMDHLKGWQRAFYRRVLEMARRYAPLRDECRGYILLCLLLARDVLHEVGRRLEAEGVARTFEESNLLTWREVLAWLDGTTSSDEVRRLLAERRALYRRWWRYAPPDRIEQESGSPASDMAAMNTENALSGLAVSPGIAHGCARVINTLGEAGNVLPGEVLVCREPLFELSPLFSLVAAVVAESGSLLDHAAVLAREYGVPAVFGVERATARVRTGEELWVDANRGLVVRQQAEIEWELL